MIGKMTTHKRAVQNAAKKDKKIGLQNKMEPRCSIDSAHPDHSSALPRLNKVQGQLDGIQRMIQERRYCVDILIQFRAVLAALRTVEISIFETHLQHCLQSAMRSHDEKMIESKIRELTELLSRRSVI